MEGVWGFVITMGIIYPIMNAIPGSDGRGVVEDLPDTFYMFAHTPLIIVFSILYFICILFLNWAGMIVT